MTHHRLHVVRIAMLAIVAVVSPASSQTQTWSAMSTTAIAITGPISVSPTRIVLAKNATLPLALAINATAFKTDQGVERANIYRVTMPSNPSLLSGNKLCSAPVRWVALWQLPASDLGMAVFSSTARPQSESSTGLCGTFTYSRSK